MDLFTTTTIAYVLMMYALAQYSICKTSKENVSIFFILYYLLEDLSEKIPAGNILVALLWICSPIIVPIFWVVLLTLTLILPTDDALHYKGSNL